MDLFYTKVGKGIIGIVSSVKCLKKQDFIESFGDVIVCLSGYFYRDELQRNSKLSCPRIIFELYNNNKLSSIKKFLRELFIYII